MLDYGDLLGRVAVLEVVGCGDGMGVDRWDGEDETRPKSCGFMSASPGQSGGGGIGVDVDGGVGEMVVGGPDGEEVGEGEGEIRLGLLHEPHIVNVIGDRGR